MELPSWTAERRLGSVWRFWVLLLGLGLQGFAFFAVRLEFFFGV